MPRDPFEQPEVLIRRVYAYVAYRVGDGADAEDVTSEVFENALRYRSSYDATRGEPLAWLIGIARRSIANALAARAQRPVDMVETPAPGDMAAETVERLALDEALASLSERDQELIALRYGADLKSQQIAWILEIPTTNAAEVAVHRAVARLREALRRQDEPWPEPFEEWSEVL